MRPQRCMGNDEQCPQVQRKGQSHILVACRSLVITNTIFNEARGTIICGGLRSINAHAEQERSESTELDTVRVSSETADGEVQTNEEATVYVHDLEFFVTVQILEDTPAILSPGKLCEDHGYSYEWACGQKNTSYPKWQKHPMQHRKVRTNRCPRIINRFSSSSASTLPKSLPQNTSDASSSSPAITRRRNTSIPVLGNQLRDPTENQKHNQKQGHRTGTGTYVARFARAVRGVH